MTCEVAKSPPHVYDSAGFDRAVELRRDEAALEALRRTPSARLLLLHGLRVPVRPAAGGWRLSFLPLREVDARSLEALVFLGRDRSGPIFAASTPHPRAGAVHLELREVGATLPRIEAGIAALARALLHWHARHRHCGACGHPTAVREGGHLRRCRSCGLDVFPRTDPAIIVLVVRGAHCLLARAPRFPPGMYSTLAGFVEPAESLEAAVRREVREEVGLELDGLTYVSSQPWPFPQSLMIGFRARAREGPLHIDREELVDARWFTRAELLDAERRPVRLPPPDSIARYLIDSWLCAGA